MVESARIARGNIKSIDKLHAVNFDALIIPGGELFIFRMQTCKVVCNVFFLFICIKVSVPQKICKIFGVNFDLYSVARCDFPKNFSRKLVY